MDLHADKTPADSSSVSGYQDASELERAEVAVFVRHAGPAERLSSRLVDILPVVEDGNADRSRSHNERAPPVRPRGPGGGEQ